MLPNNLFQCGAYLYSHVTEKYYITFSDFNKTIILAYICTFRTVLQRVILSLINLLRWSMSLKYFLYVFTNKKYPGEHNHSLEAYSRSRGQ